VNSDLPLPGSAIGNQVFHVGSTRGEADECLDWVNSDRTARECRLAPSLASFHPVDDASELIVSVRVLSTFPRLPLPLQAEIHRDQHPPYRRRTHRMALLAQFARQSMRAFDRPTQRARRRTSGRRLDHPVQGPAAGMGVARDKWFAERRYPTTGSTNRARSRKKMVAIR